MAALNCLICDDHPMVAEALVMAVSMRRPDAAITIAADFPAAIAAASAMSPDLCLVDLDMPGAAPRQGVAGVQAAAPAAKLVIISGTADDALMLDLLAMGIAGFVAKTESPAVIAAAIDLVLAGGRHLPRRLAEMGKGVRQPEAPASVLSARQLDVVRLLAKGLTNKDIARTLGVAPATVKTHVTHAMLALGAANRTDAAVKARELGLLQSDDSGGGGRGAG